MVVRSMMAFVVAGGLTCAPAANARNYATQVGSLPGIAVADAASFTGTRATDPGLRQADLARLAAEPLDGPPSKLDTASLIARRRAHPVHASAQVRRALPAADVARLVGARVVTQPTPEFTLALAKRYKIAGATDVKGIWAFHEREASTLDEDTRTANAVIRWVLAARRNPTGASATPPDDLDPAATHATVRLEGGLALRSKPWGPSSGTVLHTGAGVELVAPAYGVWYRAKDGSGWVPGTWLAFK